MCDVGKGLRLGGRVGVGGDDGRESTVVFLDTGGACGLEGGMIGFGAPLVARTRPLEALHNK